MGRKDEIAALKAQIAKMEREAGGCVLTADEVRGLVATLAAGYAWRDVVPRRAQAAWDNLKAYDEAHGLTSNDLLMDEQRALLGKSELTSADRARLRELRLTLETPRARPQDPEALMDALGDVLDMIDQKEGM